MLDRIMLWFSKLLQRTGRFLGLVKVGIFLTLFLPIIFMIYRDHQTTTQTAKDLVFSRREAISSLAATLLDEKFNSFINLGIAITAQENFQRQIQEGNWEVAIQDLDHAGKNLSAIDNIVLLDPSGTIHALTPSIPEVVGKNFSYRDYYLGVSKNWEPYVSEVFKRSVEPYDNIMSIAIPIRSNNEIDGEKPILGILLFTIKLDTVLAWAQAIDVGSGGFVYFTDQKGNVAGHPKYSADKEVINFSSVPVVQQALKGEEGVTVAYNPIENENRLSAFKQILPYGWVVIVQQPTETAFAKTNAALKSELIEDLTLGTATAVLLFFILNVLFAVNRYHQKERIYLESVGDGLIGIDRAWNITLWNKAATTLTGWEESEVMGHPFRKVIQFINEENRAEDIRFIEETMLFGEVRFMGKHTLLKQKGGTEIAVADSSSPIFNERGVVNGAIIIFRDNSKDRELEKAREEFSSLATHQLRTPVTVIKNFAEVLTDTSLTGEQQESVKEIARASESLNELVNALLNVSRIESGSIGINPSPLFIPDTTDAVIRELSPEITRKKLAVEVQYSNSLPSLNADENLLKAITRNLLSNAVKYTPINGKITLAVNKTATDIVISITDTGMGIPQDEQKKIFSKFFRAENAHSAEIPGTGLGLYMIQAVMKQAGGKVWFESTEGKGSSFHVSIPLTGMIKKEGMKGLT